MERIFSTPPPQPLPRLNSQNADTPGTLATNGTSLFLVSESKVLVESTLQGNVFNGADQLLKLDAAAALPAVSGASLTDLNATEITSGSLDDARLSANVTVAGNTFNGANQLVQMTAAAKLPAVDGLINATMKITTLPTITAGDLFIWTGDIHYQTTGVGTKNKAPNFYA